MSKEKRPLRKRLKKHSPFVIEEVIVDNYVTELYAAEFFSDQDKDRITDLKGRPQREELVRTLMHKKEGAIQEFLDISRKPYNQPQIYAEVMSEDEAAEQHEARRQDEVCRAQTDQSLQVVAHSSADQGMVGAHEWAGILTDKTLEKFRPSIFLDHIRKAGLITQKEWKVLQKERLERDRSLKLLCAILPTKGKGSLEKFCQIIGDVDSKQLTLFTKSSNSHEEHSTMLSDEGCLESAEHIKGSYPSGRKRKKSPNRSQEETLHCVHAKRLQDDTREGATFCFRKKDEENVKSVEVFIRSMCFKCFGIAKEDIIFLFEGESAGSGYVFYGDLKDKVAVLHMYGVEPSIVQRYETCLITFLADTIGVGADLIHFLEAKHGTTFVLFSIQIKAYLRLVCALGETRQRHTLGSSLKQMFPEMHKATFRLGGLPEIQVYPYFEIPCLHESDNSDHDKGLFTISFDLPSGQDVPGGRRTGQKIVLMQNFAFHLFFMVTRMPYQVLGAQWNDLNNEYMSGGISGLFDVVTQYIEKAAAGLQLWSDETHVASNRLRPRYEQIKKMVQRSLEEVKSEYVPTDIGGQRYGFIQQEADQLTRDMHVHLQVADPHIIFIFDFHRKVAVLNSRWSAVLNMFEANLSPMEMKIFRNEARDFLVMTRSVPNIFTPLYVVAIQGARYHCSRFQLSQQSDSHEFGLQLTFIRFLSDRMRTNLEPDNAVQFIKLYVPQDVPYKERLLELYEAGLLTVQDLHAENFSCRSSKATGINDDPELQKVLELSKQDTQMKAPKDTELDEDLQIAMALSLIEYESTKEVSLDGVGTQSGHKHTISGQSKEPSNKEFHNLDASVVCDTGQQAKLRNKVNSDGVDAQSGHKHTIGGQSKEPSHEESHKLDASVVCDTGQQAVDEFLVASSSGKTMADVTFELGQNPRFLAFHREAIKEGLVEGCFLRIDVVGRDRVGKTSLAKSLLSEKFDKDQDSTEGVKSIEVSVKVAHNWEKREHGCDMLEMCNHFTAIATVQKLQGCKESEVHTTDYAISRSRDSDSGISLTLPSLTGNVRLKTGLHTLQSTITSHETASVAGSSFSDTMVPNTHNFTQMRSLKMDSFVQKLLPNIKPQSLGDISTTVKELVTRYYTGELPMDVECNPLHVTVFDYGGHSAYRPSHTPFLSRKGVKLVVLKMSESLETDCSMPVFKSRYDANPQKWGNLCITNWEVVEEWLSYVYVTADEQPHTLPSVQGRFVPAVILVATHIDEVDEQVAKDQETFVNLKLKGKPYEKHIVRDTNGRVLVSVDNTKSEEGSDKGIKYLKQTIESIANDMKTNVPLRWLQLAHAVMELRKMIAGASQLSEPMVALEDIRYLADRLQAVTDESDLKNAVEFLSDNGVIVSRPMRHIGSKQDMIIIDPKWLTEQFCKILTVHSRSKLDKRFGTDLDILEARGILSGKFASYLLSGTDEEVILEFMEAYNLICLYELPSQVKQSAALFLTEALAGPVDPYDLKVFSRSCISESPAFFVPSMLRPCKPRAIPEPQFGETVTHLWFRLPDCLIPDQIFYQLLALLVKTYPFMPQLFYREGIFNVRRGHRLHLVSEVYFLRLSMYIIKDHLGKHTRKLCDQVRQTIQGNLSKSLKQDLPGLCRLQRGIRPVALKDTHGDVDFDFAVIKRKKNIHYVRTKKGETIQCPDELTFWFEDMQSSEASGGSHKMNNPLDDKENQRMDNPPDDKKKQNLLTDSSSVKMLFEGDEPGYLLKAVALLLDNEQSSARQAQEQCIAANDHGWRSLCKYLLKYEPPVDKMESMSPTIFIIKAWIDMVGEEATIGSLISAFSAIKRNDAANVLIWNINRPDAFYNFYALGDNTAVGMFPSVTNVYNIFLGSDTSEPVIHQCVHCSSGSTT